MEWECRGHRRGGDKAGLLVFSDTPRTFLPPTALYALLGHPDVRNHDYSSLRHFAFGAAPIAPERLAEAVEVFGPVMAQVFGQTEAPMLCTYMPPEVIAEYEKRIGRKTLGNMPACVAESLFAYFD